MNRIASRLGRALRTPLSCRCRTIMTNYPDAVDKNALISAEELYGLLQDPDNDITVVDVRNPATYATGHIPGAVNVHDCFTYLAETTPAGLMAMKAHFEEQFSRAGMRPDSRIVVYEQQMNTGYGQSCRGYFLLKYMGFEKVSVLNGALAAWMYHKMPLSTAPVPPPRSQFQAKINSSLMVNRDELLEIIKKPPPNHVLLDCRDKDEWIGDSSSPYGKDFAPKKGRIPGAEWAEWYHFLHYKNGISQFQTAEAILDEAYVHHIERDSNVTIYCFKGSRASNTMLALQMAGVAKVRNAFGGWNEWSRDNTLPVDTAIIHD